MPVTNPDYSNIDHEEMAAQIGLKVKHIPLLIESFLEESGSIIEKIENAIPNKDYEALKGAAHSIKGSAGNLKFTQVYEMARKIELAAGEANDTFEYSAYSLAIKKAVNTIKL